MKLILKALLSLMLTGILVVALVYMYIKVDLPDIDVLKDIQLQQPMQVFTADGELIGEIGEQQRQPVELHEVPPLLINAVLAIEDNRFYEHHGIDLIGIARAIKVIYENDGKLSQGASTITQQVAKNFFLTPEKKIIRKIKEIFLALEIEQELTKDEILELYLNKIFLGHRTYGVKAAAYLYFGKQLDELTLSEIAVIAGLPKAPGAINPVTSVTRATQRRDVVLGRMLDKGYINQEEYDQAKAEPVLSNYHGRTVSFRAEYVVEIVRQEMIKRYGEYDAYNKGFKIYTTIESKNQKSAINALRDNLLDYNTRHGYRGADVLWTNSDTAWDNQRIEQHLKQLPRMSPLHPGVIVKAGNNLTVQLRNERQVTVKHAHLSLANKNRPYKFAAGQLIWLVQNDKLDWVLSQIPKVNSGIISIDSRSGAIQAMVGGFSYSQSKFNRALQSSVQVGSSIKPFIYAAALDKGLTLATMINDLPITRIVGNDTWSPKNSPNVYEGPLRLRVGIGKSKNVMAIRTLRLIGVDFAAEYLQRFGFPRNRYQATESLALGAASFTPLEMARAYAVFNNGGFLIDPYIIDSVLDANDAVVYKATPKLACGQTDCANITTIYEASPKLENISNVIQDTRSEDQREKDSMLAYDYADDRKYTDYAALDSESVVVPDLPELSNLSQQENESQEIDFSQPQLEDIADPYAEKESPYAPKVIDSEIAFLIKEALRTAIVGEPGWTATGWRAAREFKRNDIGGKTGTTNQSKVAWYAGYGANVVTVVYVGSDDNRDTLGRGESGSKTAQPAWNMYMKDALANIPQVPITPPENIIKLKIDKTNGLLGEDLDEYFLLGTEPTGKVVKESGYSIDADDGEIIELF